jgi:hypothetical protein
MSNPYCTGKRGSDGNCEWCGVPMCQCGRYHSRGTCTECERTAPPCSEPTVDVVATSPWPECAELRAQLVEAQATGSSDLHGCDPIREGSKEKPEWENNPI